MSHRSKRQKLRETGESNATSFTRIHRRSFGSRKDACAEPSRTLFVRALAPNTTSEHLVEYFSQSALLKHATAVLDSDSKTCKGYGFVTFIDIEDAQRAQVKLNNTELNGRRISVGYAQPRHRNLNDGNASRNRSSAAQDDVDQSSTQFGSDNGALENNPLALPRLIVRNLPWSVKDSEQLTSIFKSFGKVKDVQLPRQPSGALRGFGFVLMRGRKNAEKAMADLNGRILDGRTLAVDWAAPKDTWEKQQNMGSLREKSSTSESLPIERDSEVSESEATEPDQRGNETSSGEEEEEESAASVSSQTGSSVQHEHTGGPSNSLCDRTLFVRNLPYTADDDTIYQHFRVFGPLQYARVVMDYTYDPQGRSRGTGFVCFHRREDAVKCLRQAPEKANFATQAQKGQAVVHQSLLQDTQSDPFGMYTLDGRLLQVTSSLDKSTAQELDAQGRAKRNRQDKRNLYLLREGGVSSQSPLFELMSPAETRMRETSARQRQSLLQKNPSLFVSMTRLAIRNIPRFVSSKDLKVLARQAVSGFDEDVERGIRQPLNEEEMSRCAETGGRGESLPKSKRKSVISQAKIVFENRDGSKVNEGNASGRSRGYGFVEYANHRCALMGLRWLNGYLIKSPEKVNTGDATAQSDSSKRLIVEFAIENAQVVRRRQERQERSRQRVDEGIEPISSGIRSRIYSDRSFDEEKKPISTSGTSEQVHDRKTAISRRIIGRKRAKRRGQNQKK